jgi:hypothetical protein
LTSDRDVAISQEHASEGIQSREINWEQPVINAAPVGRPEDAGKHTDFQPAAPPRLGDPRRVLVTAPGSAAREDRVLSFEYQHPEYGRFLVLQSVNETNSAELAAIAARCTPESGCEGSTSMEVLRNGQPALLIEGPTATSITWFRGRVRFDVIGPAGEFPPEAARGVANSY